MSNSTAPEGWMLRGAIYKKFRTMQMALYIVYGCDFYPYKTWMGSKHSRTLKIDNVDKVGAWGFYYISLLTRPKF